MESKKKEVPTFDERIVESKKNETKPKEGSSATTEQLVLGVENLGLK